MVLPAVTVLGFGLATTVAPLTAAVLAAAPSEHAGIASAVNNDVARTAALIAVGVLPAVAGITGGSYLHPDHFHGFPHGGVGGGSRVRPRFAHRGVHHPQPGPSTQGRGAGRTNGTVALRARCPVAREPHADVRAAGGVRAGGVSGVTASRFGPVLNWCTAKTDRPS